MRNTGIEYTSAERTPTILPDLAELLPPLSGEQLAALEKDILQNGCYAPIIVNEDLVVVDGHNRQQICTRHDLPYKMAVFAFDDLLEAKQWALDTQKGRRNLDKWELGKIALKLRPEIEARAKANQGARSQRVVGVVPIAQKRRHHQRVQQRDGQTEHRGQAEQDGQDQDPGSQENICI